VLPSVPSISTRGVIFRSSHPI